MLQKNKINHGQYAAVPCSTNTPFGRLLKWLAGRHTDAVLTATQRTALGDAYFNDLPILGKTEWRTDYFSCSEEILDHLPDDYDRIFLASLWLKDGAFHEGKLWENSPDVIFAEIADFGSLSIEVMFIHNRVFTENPSIPFSSLMSQSKLGSAAILPKWIHDLPERFFDLASTKAAISSISVDTTFPLSGVSDDDFSVMTLTEKFKLLCAHKLKEQNAQSS